MNTLPCIVCDKKLDPVWEDSIYVQPSDGMICKTSGNYGSRVLDNVGPGERDVVFCLCDECFIKAADKGYLAQYPDPPKPAPVPTEPYKVEDYVKLWVESETHEEYEEKLKEAGIELE